MTGYPVLRVGGHDNTIVRRILGDEPSHAHVDEGGDQWFAVTRSAQDAALIVEAVNGHAPAVAAEVEAVRRECEQRIADLQAEVGRHFAAWDRLTKQLTARVTELEEVHQAAARLLPLIEEGQNEVATGRAAAALRVALPGWADVREGSA